MAASRVACASFNIGTNTTITITRDSSSYTHTITYKFGNATGTIATKTGQTSVVWSPAAATLYAQIPNAVSGYGTITCVTFDGNIVVGVTTASFYAYAVKANCIPDLSAAVVDTNASTIAVTGNSSILVRYISKPKVTLTASAKNSATIKTYNINNPVGLVATTNPYTFDTVYSDTFKCTVTDSRGYSKLIDKVISNFIEYDPAHFDTFSIRRTESTSTTAVFTASGFCFKGNFGSQDNTLTVKCRYKTTGSYGAYTTLSGVTWNNDGSFSITANITGLSLADTYTFEFVVEDKLSSYTSGEVILSQGTGDLRIGQDYIQTKNEVRIGDTNNTDWKGIKARRKINGTPYSVSIGVGNPDNTGTCSIELYKNNVRAARYDLKEDGHIYDYASGLSLAAMAASAPTMESPGNQGYLLLDGGSATPILIQWGRLNITPSAANAVTSVSVNFNLQFASVPQVHVSRIHALNFTMEGSNGTPTRSGVTIYAKAANTNAVRLFWLAIGNGTGSLPE